MFRTTVSVATLGLLAVGLTAPPAAADPPAPGTCLLLTSRQWDRSTLPAVAGVNCAGSHTAEVMGNVGVPKKVWRSGSKAFWAWAFRKCHTVGITYVWGNQSAPLPVSSYARPMSAQLATYEPNHAEINAGQRWVSCVGFNTTPTGSVASRSGSIAFSGLQPQFCVSNRTWKWQSCSAAASVPLTNVVWLKGYKAKYPGTAKAVKLARKKCTKLANSRGRKALTWYVPGKNSWNYGDHFGYCQIS